MSSTAIARRTPASNFDAAQLTASLPPGALCDTFHAIRRRMMLQGEPEPEALTQARHNIAARIMGTLCPMLPLREGYALEMFAEAGMAITVTQAPNGAATVVLVDTDNVRFEASGGCVKIALLRIVRGWAEGRTLITDKHQAPQRSLQSLRRAARRPTLKAVRS